jgi:hypothetical protein
MREQSTDSSLVRMDIGGLGIDLNLESPYLAQRIRQHYRHYQPFVRERFMAEVALVSEPPFASLLTSGTDFQAGVLYLHSPGCEGYIDASQKSGRLRLNTSRPREEIEYLLRMVCALLAFEAGGLLLHAAGVIHKGRAHVFFGYSGSGKSTVARLSSQDVVINDDLLLLMPAEDGWQVHATPFWNDYQSQPPASPEALAGLYRLVQDQEVFLEDISRAQAVAELVSSAPVVSADPSRSHTLLQRCQSILENAPSYRLHFLEDASFWQVIEVAD